MAWQLSSRCSDWKTSQNPLFTSVPSFVFCCIHTLEPSARPHMPSSGCALNYFPVVTVPSYQNLRNPNSINWLSASSKGQSLMGSYWTKIKVSTGLSPFCGFEGRIPFLDFSSFDRPEGPVFGSRPPPPCSKPAMLHQSFSSLHFYGLPFPLLRALVITLGMPA